MKKTYDPELKILITGQIVSYDMATDELRYDRLPVTRSRKNGYMTYDERGRNIGIVFMSDDKKTARYGNAEILFFKKYKNEFGIWRVIRRQGAYIPFDYLQDVISRYGKYTVTTDARHR